MRSTVGILCLQAGEDVKEGYPLGKDSCKAMQAN